MVDQRFTDGPRVTVLRDRYIPGGVTDGVSVIALGAALTSRHSTDAHFQQGHAPDGNRITAQSTLPVTMTAIAFDVDAPQHYSTPDWRGNEDPKLARLAFASRLPFIADTRGGYRIVFQLSRPFEIRTEADFAEWRARYLAACDELARFGIECDRSCADAQRLFRLPHATRDRGGKPEELPTLGDPSHLVRYELPDAPRPPSVGPRAAALEANVGCNGKPASALLYRKLAAIGAILRPHGENGFLITCPRNRLHSVGRPGDGSTTLYLPSTPGGWGEIHCMHHSCAGMSAADWIAVLEQGDEPAIARRVVRIDGVGIDSNPVRLVMGIAAADGAGTLPLRYLRCYADGKPRWKALWEAAGVEPPDDLNVRGDLGAACRELEGRTIGLELAGATVRRIIPAQEYAA